MVYGIIIWYTVCNNAQKIVTMAVELDNVAMDCVEGMRRNVL